MSFSPPLVCLFSNRCTAATCRFLSYSQHRSPVGAARRVPRGADAGGYILIAIPSQHRADAIRQLALDLSSNVVVLRDGADVIRHIDSHGAPTLLITDISLPQVDGLDVLRHVGRRTAMDACSVVVVSAHEAMRAAARVLAPSLGIAKILPFDADRPALREALSAAWLNVRPAAATVPPACGHVPNRVCVGSVDQGVRERSVVVRRRLALGLSGSSTPRH